MLWNGEKGYEKERMVRGARMVLRKTQKMNAVKPPIKSNISKVYFCE